MAANSRYSELLASSSHEHNSRASRGYAVTLPLPSDDSRYYDPHASSSGDVADHTRAQSPHYRNASPMKAFNVVEAQRAGEYQPNFGKYGYQEHRFQEVYVRDRVLKDRIRTLRVFSRILSVVLSLAVLVPITMTLVKFLQTRNIFREAPTADGGTILRSAWALQTKAWPTYMYFSVAAMSFLLHGSALIGYLCSVHAANKASTVATVFDVLIFIGSITVWAVVVSIYKKEKETLTGGKHDDLWGWTCSGPAQAIQDVFKDVVPFNTYCNVQSASWFAGLVQVGALLLTGVIYGFVWARKGSKKAVRTSMNESLIGREPYRQ